MNRLAQTRDRINDFYRLNEEVAVAGLLHAFPDINDGAIKNRASQWIDYLRRHPGNRTLLEDFMQRYSLSTEEGIALMSIAEAFLRVPDTDMADRLIIDKITHADWNNAGDTDSKLITTLSGWGLRLSDAVLQQQTGTVGILARRLGLPVIRQAVAQAIKLLGGQFVCGRTINEALRNADRETGAVFSYDMLGEGARTAETAAQYFENYKQAIEAVGTSKHSPDLYASDGVSVKLSALHPRYEEFQRDRCLPILIARVRELALLGQKYNLLITLDAEEADRLEISLDIFTAVLTLPELAGYNGLGLAVQAYQKRALAVIDYLVELARLNNKIIPIRLVKGAYWDSEIKRAQERGLSGYPVYTRKIATDVSYLVAADKILAAHEVIYPAFATHNAFTLSAIFDLAKKHDCRNFEFQRLFGMGQQLYDAAYASHTDMPRCRVYAPVGAHQDLLPYLVRRLLENGANSSFIHQLYDKNIPVETLTENPAKKLKTYAQKANKKIPLPSMIYADRKNSVAPDLTDIKDRNEILSVMATHRPAIIAATNITDIDKMFQDAKQHFTSWQQLTMHDRAVIVDNIADQYERHRDELLAYCVKEGKKTLPDAIAEWREAIDFCRYYAQQARDHLKSQSLTGPTGETNILSLQGRGVFVCISPWNFPLAIFTGQIVAALVTGNAVIAKPAEQTPAIAALAVRLMHRAGIPKEILQLVIGEGHVVGAACVAHPLCAGVVFTGSTDTAWRIQEMLAKKQGPIIPFIAETGGQNAMVVDSTALTEQVVDDVIRSAFHSAGQRCSALRVLFLQDDIADAVISMLRGAMQELVVGDPSQLATDIGPVIDDEACRTLQDHITALQDRKIAQAPTSDLASIITPTLFKISSINDLDKENFGPILHIVTYSAENLDKIIADINAIGYGLTLGIHSRIESRIAHIVSMANVGNIYINRSMIGATVGVQPFGGMGLSGTGPKAGGPHYLYRFVTEKTVSTNTTASGGNTILATLSDE